MIVARNGPVVVPPAQRLARLDAQLADVARQARELNLPARSATLLWNGYLGRLSKLTRADIAELAPLPGLGDAAAQCSALCWAVLAPPLPWLAWILLWASAGFALKGAPLSSVGILTAYLFSIWLTYLAIALLKLATYPPSRRSRLSHFSEFPLLYFSVYLCAVYYNIYTLHSFVHGGPLFWAFWATPTLVGIGFASAIGYSVHKLATAPHPFVGRDSAFSSS